MKVKSVLLCVLLTGILFSCKKGGPTYIIGVSQCSDDEWRDKMNEELKLEAMFYEGVQVEIRPAYDNNERQIRDIQYFIDKGVDLLVVSPNESAPVTPIIEKAFESGIPVIVTDRKITSEKYTAYIGPDNYEIGELAGEYIAKFLRGSGNIVEIMGTSGSTPAIERHAGFINIIKKHPEINVVYQEDAVFLKSLGEKKMEEALLKNKNIDLVFAHNDRMAAGAFKAAQKAKRENEMVFVGIDAVPGEHFGVAQVIDGTLLATFLNPTGGDQIVQMAMNILNEKDFPRETTLPTNIVDQRNARVSKLQSDYIGKQKEKINSLNDKIDSSLNRYTNQRVILYGSLVLLLLVVGLFYVTLKSNKSIKHLNKKLSGQNEETNSQKEQLEVQRDQLVGLSKELEEATHAKLMFFTNISHDFLTPLTLVIEPIAQLVSKGNLSRAQLQMMGLIEKNVNILIRLVKQILDFRNYEDGKMELVLSENDLNKCVKEWNDIFMPSFYRKKIKFRFETTDDFPEYRFAFDKEKIQRAYFNLISNAIKFTDENGRISVKLSSCSVRGNKHALIKISDTGIGLSVEHVQNIFDRFYKVDAHHAGSGIGLALVKAFVDLHGGEITVESKRGTGTVFTIMLPVERTKSSCPLSANLNPEVDEDIFLTAFEDDFYNHVALSDGRAREWVLIIDDNPDILEYVSILLKEEYNILRAKDGREGLRKAIKHVPDIILCDVMMPVMTGLECCRRLKSEMLTCHVPIIMLTVCDRDEQRIEGLKYGADAYVSKPFNSKVLQAQIRTLIEGRRQLKEFFVDKTTFSNEPISGMDRGFLEKLMLMIEQNLSNSDLNIEGVGRMIGLSRVQLYRKVKSLTDNSPNELIRFCRLKKSKSLLASSDMSVSEIAYEVGFSSPSYFTKCYKDYFGENPTIFLKRIEEGT
ncbi:MAG TPA: substrate-binding domain-containing protein [Pricia sp.]|nr:substrate-binding domain-containing protein [Pricia sp.]